MLQKYGLGWWALQLPAVRVIVGSSHSGNLSNREILTRQIVLCSLHTHKNMICHLSSGKSTFERSE